MRDRQPVKVEIFGKIGNTVRTRGGERHAGDLPILTIAPVRDHRVKSTIGQKCEYLAYLVIFEHMCYTLVNHADNNAASSV